MTKWQAINMLLEIIEHRSDSESSDDWKADRAWTLYQEKLATLKQVLKEKLNPPTIDDA